MDRSLKGRNIEVSLYTLCKNQSITELLNGKAFVRELLLLHLEISSHFPYLQSHSASPSNSHSAPVIDLTCVNGRRGNSCTLWSTVLFGLTYSHHVPLVYQQSLDPPNHEKDGGMTIQLRRGTKANLWPWTTPFLVTLLQ